MAERLHGPRVHSLLSYFARHRTAANLILVLFVVAGLLVAPKMRAQFFPDVVVEEVIVSVSWPGAGPEDVDAGIIQPLEPRLLAVEGVSWVSARATEGSGRMTLAFEPGWDMGRATADVESAVDGVTTLPQDAKDPVIRRGGWRDRVTDVIISGPVDPESLGRFADEFNTRLFALGITRTTIQGLAAPNVLVEVPSLALIEHGVTMAEIAAAIGQEADADPAGSVAGANSRVRTGIAKRTADDIARIRLRANLDGSALTVGDLAHVSVEGADREAAFFVGNHPAISIRVDRSDKGDAIRIQNQVADAAAEMTPTLPRGVGIDLIRTRAEAISARLNILGWNGLQGLGLVLLLLLLFLNARTALWVAMGIPVSMLATVALMYLFGISINMISLFALIITTGIIVDDAIVVGEHADFRARERGEAPVEAAENAATRMFAPVFSSTATTVIAFLGLTAIGGRFGAVVFDIPFTVTAVLTASLLECFLILPNHMAHALAHSGRQHWYDWPSRQVNRGFGWVRDRIVRRIVRLMIAMRYPVLAAAILLLVSQVALFIRGDLQWRFFNAPEQPSISGNFAVLPAGTRDDTMAQLREMQRAVEATGKDYEARYGVNPVAYVTGQIGGGSGRGLAGAEGKDSDQLGAISIELIDPDLRPYSSFAFLSDLESAVRTLPMTETLSFRGWRQGPGGDAIDIDLFGADTGRLKDAAEALKTALAAFPEVSALEDSLAYDKDELILELTPQGHALGFTIDRLAADLRSRLSGIDAAEFPDGPRSAKIRVELPEDELTADLLDRIRLPTAAGDYIALGDIVSVERTSGFSTIRRENGLRVVTVSGDLAEDDAARAVAVSEALETGILPRIEEEYGVASRIGGLTEDEGEFLNDATLGFMGALIGIYAVLAWVFASWSRPIVVMAIIPFGLIGATWGHVHWDVPLSMYSVIGLIGMTGIIINDSIVLVSTVDEYAVNRGLMPAVVDAVADRLRPVFLTTTTTVFGLAPLLYESSQQAQFLKPTVITLVYGLGFGMVLVLLLVPAILAMQHDVRRQFAAMRRALRRRRAAVAVPAIVYLVGAAGLFWPTLGSEVVRGEGWSLLGDGLGGAFLAFVLGSAILALAVWAVSALVLTLRRKPT